MTSKLFLLTIFILTFHYGTGQERNIILKHLSSEDGLSDNRVTCMLRDKQGFMWFGTKDGLNRYDGRNFYVFRNRVNDSTSLCSNNITCLSYDNDSILWIGTSSSGFCSYDFRTQKFETYNNRRLGHFSNTVNAISFDSVRNALWLGLNSGLYLFSLQTRTLLLSDPDSLRGVYDVRVHDTTVFVASLVQSLKKAGDPISPGGDGLTPALTINTIFKGSDGRLWCGAWDNALHEFNDDLQFFRSYIFDGTNQLNFSTDEIISIAEDVNRILWCGTKSSGLHFFDLKSKSFITNLHLSETVTSRIYSIYRDDFNRMWVGTEQGLYVHDPLQNQFDVTLLPLPNEKFNCRVFDRVITEGGAEYIIAVCGLFYRKKKEKEYHFRYFEYQNERLQLTSILKSQDGNILIGTNKSIFILDTITVELNLIEANDQLKNILFYSLYSSRITGLSDVRIGNRNLIAGLAYGHTILMADLKQKNLYWMGPPKGDTTMKYEYFFRKIFPDTQNRVWICGATQGITQILVPPEFHPDTFPVLDTQNHKINVGVRDWKNMKRNPINDVYDIVENNDGSFWLTSEVSGLIRFFPDNNETPFSFVKGEYKSLQGLAKQDENMLWIITSKGLLNYNVSSGIYKLFDSKQGVPQGIGGHFFDDSDSSISAGFEGGFVSFNPNRIRRDSEKPRVQLTRLWVMDEINDSLLLNKLVLKHDRNFLKFYLSSNCFSNNDQVTYMYQLTGIDHDWRNNENNPFITYTNLPPGKYELKFKAVNSDGIESEIRSIPVIITPPFYKTIFFYLLVAITIFLGAYLFYRYRIRQILKLQEVRNKIARDLHDDIGSTIGSINLYSQVANIKLNGLNNRDVKSILDKIENSSREIIDKTGDAVWAANPANDSLKNLLLRIEGYAASVLGAAGIEFQIICDEKLSETFLEMDERKNLFLICKEAIHNIIKYAGASMVTITIGRKEGRIRMIISDNGKGFSENTSVYNGNGIKNMKARVESMKGTFSIRGEENKGTTVDVIL